MIVFDARKLGGYDVFLHHMGSALFNPHSLPMAVLSGAMALGLSYSDDALAWLGGSILQSTSYFGGISFIVGFTVVYRAQIAYQRYDQAQESYFGMASKLHDFVSMCSAFLVDADSDAQTRCVRGTIIRWARAYHELALEEFQGIDFGLHDRENLSTEEVQLLARDRKRTIQISSWMQRIVVDARSHFKAGDAIVSRAFQVLSEANLHHNNTRRVAETPFVSFAAFAYCCDE